MNEFKKFRNRIIFVSASLIVSTALVFLHFGLTAVAFGFTLGGAGSVAKLWVSSAQIMKSASGKSRAAVGGKVRAAMMTMLSRYGLIAVCLAIGFFIDSINQIAVICAVFTTNVVLIVSEVARNYFPGALGAFFGRTRARVGDN